MDGEPIRRSVRLHALKGVLQHREVGQRLVSRLERFDERISELLALFALLLKLRRQRALEDE